MPEVDPSPTDLLERISPVWAWVRRSFTLPAVLTIAGILASAAGYIISLRTRVTVLEREVIVIKEVAPDKASLAALTQHVLDHDERIGRLEKDWDDARELAGMPPRPLRPQHLGHK